MTLEKRGSDDVFDFLDRARQRRLQKRKPRQVEALKRLLCSSIARTTEKCQILRLAGSDIALASCRSKRIPNPLVREDVSFHLAAAR